MKDDWPEFTNGPNTTGTPGTLPDGSPALWTIAAMSDTQPFAKDDEETITERMRHGWRWGVADSLEEAARPIEMRRIVRLWIHTASQTGEADTLARLAGVAREPNEGFILGFLLQSRNEAEPTFVDAAELARCWLRAGGGYLFTPNAFA